MTSSVRRIPKIKAGVNVSNLALEPEDGFLLSRIDGAKSAEDLADLFGESTEAMNATLDRLATVGVIEFDDPAARPRGTLPGGAAPKRIETAKPGVGMSMPPPANPPIPQMKVPGGLGALNPNFAAPAPMIITAKPDAGMSVPPPANAPLAPNAPHFSMSPNAHAAVTHRPEGNSIPAANRPVTPSPQISSPTESILNQADPIPPEPGSSPGASPGPAKIPSTPAMRAPYPSFSEVAEDEVVELEESHKARVLELYALIKESDYYTLLGVTKDADKKVIKRAYYEVAANVHPDKHFRKKLGSFKTRMEHVFAKLTEAHDTLTDRERRADYDAYMASVANAARMESMLEGAKSEAARLAKALEEQVRESKPAPSSGEPQSSSKMDPASLQARKDALAKRLRGGAAQPKSSPPAEFGTKPEADSARAIAALKQRYEDRLKDAQQKQVARYVDAADEALAKNDVVGAAHSLELALGFSPDDSALKARYADLRAKADTALYEAYLTQATYQERASQYGEAAKSWGRIVRLKANDARANERAAFNVLKAGGDLHEASEFAKQAVLLEPKNAQFRVTSAQVYAAANLPLAAKREAEAAMQIAPNDPAITTAAKRILSSLPPQK